MPDADRNSSMTAIVAIVAVILIAVVAFFLLSNRMPAGSGDADTSDGAIGGTVGGTIGGTGGTSN